MRSITRFRLAAAAAAIVAFNVCAAPVALRDKTQLETLLKSATPCCVIDARAEPSRKAAPLANTLPYAKGMKIKPTSVVVVIGDSDAQAVEVGSALAKSSNARDVVAVKGGAATWRSLVGNPEHGSPSGAPMSFVIPKNTCENDAPLQTLKSGRQ